MPPGVSFSLSPLSPLLFFAQIALGLSVSLSFWRLVVTVSPGSVGPSPAAVNASPSVSVPRHSRPLARSTRERARLRSTGRAFHFGFREGEVPLSHSSLPPSLPLSPQLPSALLPCTCVALLREREDRVIDRQCLSGSEPARPLSRLARLIAGGGDPTGATAEKGPEGGRAGDWGRKERRRAQKDCSAERRPGRKGEREKALDRRRSFQLSLRVRLARSASAAPARASICGTGRRHFGSAARGCRRAPRRRSS